VAVSDTLINTLFDGRYRIIRKLGAGGMANVYLAEDQELGRRVAIKILNERHANDDQFVERFRREAKNAAGLSHPNIVSIYDRGEAEGTYYIAMEYLDGRSLKELIVGRGPAPVHVAIDYTRTDFTTEVRTATNGRGVDVVLDIVGGEYLPRNLECLRIDGRLVQIGLIAGSRASLDLRSVLQKRLTITGSTLRPRSPLEKGAIARELEQHVWPLLANGTVRPIVHGEFPLDRAADAHEELESGRVIGKLVLRCSG